MMTVHKDKFLFIIDFVLKCISNSILIRFKPDRDNLNCELEENKLLVVVSSDVIMKMANSDC